MSTEVFPVIDISSFEEQFEKKTREIVEACRVWGFMILTGHQIPSLSVSHMFNLHEQFCNQPLSVKSECTVDSRQMGYDRKCSRIGVNESMVFGGARGEIEKGENLPSWWDSPKRRDVEMFKSQCHRLATLLLRSFASHFGLPPEYFSSAHNDQEGPGSVLRMLHYPRLIERPDESFPRLQTHTDWGTLTFVWPRSEGLEVETPAGEWLPVPLVPDGVVVNIGDALAMWSGQTLKSTLHRISFDSLPIDRDRWSMAYFINANEDARVEILQHAEDGTLVKKPGSPVLTSGEYLQARLFMSQREDSTKNWTGKVKKDFTRVVGIVESLGIANGSGNIDRSVVAV